MSTFFSSFFVLFAHTKYILLNCKLNLGSYLLSHCIHHATKQAGVGAVCTALTRFIHPSKNISEVMKNCAHNHHLTDLLAVRIDLKKVNREMQVHIVPPNDMFPNEELY